MSVRPRRCAHRHGERAPQGVEGRCSTPICARGPSATAISSSPSTSTRDYQTYVDGKKREDGVRSFLDSRGITLPDGDPNDESTPRRSTGWATGRTNCSSRRCTRTASRSSRDPGATSRRCRPRDSRWRSSRRAPTPARCSTSPVSPNYVEVRVDGVTMREENIAGKPAPDSFLRAAQLLDTSAGSGGGLRGRDRGGRRGPRGRLRPRGRRGPGGSRRRVAAQRS